MTGVRPAVSVLPDGSEYRIARDLGWPVTVLRRVMLNSEYQAWRHLHALEDEARANRQR